MPSSGLLRVVALVRTDVSEKRSASIIRVTIIVELGTLTLTINRQSVRLLLVIANVVPSSPILVALIGKAVRSYETSVLITVTGLNPEDGIIRYGF
jgi:hypothetical protein